MMGIGSEINKSIVLQLVDYPLDRLPSNAHFSRNMRNRLWGVSQCDGTHHLPPRAGQANVFRELIAGRQNPAVQSKQLQNELCQSRTAFGMLRPLHCTIDNMLS
jgi:hypothetical protein